MIAIQNPTRKNHSSLKGVLLLAALLVVGASQLSFGHATIPNNTAPAAPRVRSQAELPLSFEANVGQTDSAVRFMVHAPRGTLYFAPSSITLALKSASSAGKNAANSAAAISQPSSLTSELSTNGLVTLGFLGANPAPQITGGTSLPGKVNYLIGKDPHSWHTNVPTYGDITYSSLYPGVDLRYSGTEGALKGTYSIAPGSDASQIRWSYAGAKQVTVDTAGNLQIRTESATVTEKLPVAWQEIEGQQVAVTAHYNVAPGGIASFELGSYNRAYPLTIDPLLAYSTYLGGDGTEYGFGIAVDAMGNTYVTGDTTSSNFPVLNAAQPSTGGGFDAFITKLDASGSSLIYSTYLGGSGEDKGFGIAVDTEGNAYITGYTGSTDFPLMNPIQAAYGGGQYDAFVTKLNADGSALVYSTYLGGSNANGDLAYHIGLDALANAYVTGFTYSADFPAVNAYQHDLHGVTDAFVSKISTDGSALVYSTYLGGSGAENGHLDVDAEGHVYITGLTSSRDFPLVNPLQATYSGGQYDAFVAKLNLSGSALVYSTYLGGSGDEIPEGVAVDALGNAYVSGTTNSTDFPLMNPFQATYGGGRYDAYISKLNAQGSALVYSTYLGGTGQDWGSRIHLDALGEAYIEGGTFSDDFPLVDAVQPVFGGYEDAYVAKLSADGASLAFSTYLGGSGDDTSDDITVDSTGDAYIIGYTSSADFPLVTPVQSTYGGGQYDAFIAKFSLSPLLLTATPTGTIQPEETATSTSVPAATSTTEDTPTDTPTVVPTDVSTASPTDMAEETPTATFTSTHVEVLPTDTMVAEATDTPTSTLTATPGEQTTESPTDDPALTPTACTIQFVDVPQGSTFYQYVNCLACLGIISGYPDGSFHVNSNVTRGQVAKIVSNSAGYTDSQEGLGSQIFEDVPPGSTFYIWINRLASRGIMGGYQCGANPQESCVSPANRPYFHPDASATRAQVSKIIANTVGSGGSQHPPYTQMFADVPQTDVFYMPIEQAASQGVIAGYPCGSADEPCGSGNLPYFRPGNNATRGQVSKIISNTFFPGCQLSGHP